MSSRFKIFSDPVHGFISVPRRLILPLIQTPEVQRLRRIRQLGIGFLVFPGADHTRFGHALGAVALMQDALSVLAEKGTPISPEEALAAQAVALLHDIGHGPFSHTLEHELIRDFEHEQMSRALLARMNDRLGGALDLALAIFDNTYARPFFHELISSQLDMDRLDYLRRDSFFSGVVEGQVGVDRIIKTLRVEPLGGGPDARIMVEAKGVYAVENFLFARRLMYWQVYLHKTVLAGDQLLRALLRRVRMHVRRGEKTLGENCAPAFLFFLQNDITAADLRRPDVLDRFTELDDTDLLYTIKSWQRHDDPILADLARRFMHRDFFRVTFLDAEPTLSDEARWREQIAEWLVTERLSTSETAREDATYYVGVARSRLRAYAPARDAIKVLGRDGEVRELSKFTDTGALSALAGPVEKPYVYHPKGAPLKIG